MNLFHLYQKLSNDEFCFAYLDNFSDSATDALIAIQDARLASKKKIKRKVSFLVTECFQNIVRHSEDSIVEFDKLFALRSTGSHHSIVTINPIDRSKQDNLKTSLEKLENLTKDELKQIYLDSLNGNTFSLKGGAGLGLIEMARKTKQVPSYNFDKLTDNLTAFKLELTISEGLNDDTIVPSNVMDELYPSMQKNRVLLMQKGDFSQDAVLSLFELIESNLKSQGEEGIQTKKLYLLIELLQNMSTNTIEQDGKKNGIFQIRIREDGNLIFQTGNCISRKKSIILKKRLDSIKNLSKIEVLKLYHTELRKGMDSDDEEANKGGIGLLEILKLTNGNLAYEITPIDESVSFVSFTATIEK